MDMRARTIGYHMDTMLSVADVDRQAAALRGEVTREQLHALANHRAYLTIDTLCAGYGKMQVVHDFSLAVARGQSLCLIGPNGAGKSTVLHSIYGFTRVFAGRIAIDDGQRRIDVTRLSTNRKLKEAGIAYIMQDKSVFPEMTVEENLWMGGYLLGRPGLARERAEAVFEKYPRLAARRRQRAKVLSGGERRLLEISRALVMNPQILLVDEPSIGLEPRFIDMVFEILAELKKKDGKTIIIVEQNARKGLEFADIGYVLVSGEIVLAARGSELLDNPQVGRLFLGG